VSPVPTGRRRSTDAHGGSPPLPPRDPSPPRSPPPIRRGKPCADRPRRWPATRPTGHRGRPRVPRAYRSAEKWGSWGTRGRRARVPQDPHGRSSGSPFVGAVDRVPMASGTARMRVMRESVRARRRRRCDAGPPSFPLGCARAVPIPGPRPAGDPGMGPRARRRATAAVGGADAGTRRMRVRHGTS
jgi:hypothetical protein